MANMKAKSSGSMSKTLALKGKGVSTPKMPQKEKPSSVGHNIFGPLDKKIKRK